MVNRRFAVALFVVGSAVLSPSARAQSPAADAAVVAPMLRGAVVTLKVPDYTAASRQAEQAAGSAVGMLLDVPAEVREGGRRNGWMRLRIPADRPPRVVAEMRRLGIPFAEKLTTEDDISEYASLAKRADRLKEHEPRLAGVLASDGRLRGSDILFVQERLFRASVDESLLTQRRADLARKAGVSSLTVFFEPAPTSTLGQAHLNLDTQFGYAQRRAFDLLTRFFAGSLPAAPTRSSSPRSGCPSCFCSPFWAMPFAVARGPRFFS